MSTGKRVIENSKSKSYPKHSTKGNKIVLDLDQEVSRTALPYDAELSEAAGYPCSSAKVVSEQPPKEDTPRETPPGPPNQENRANVTPREAVERFKQFLNQLKSACIPPTVRSAVLKHRSELLIKLKEFKVANALTVDLLDTNWDKFGDNSLSRFFEKYLIKNPDYSLITGQQLHSYILGGSEFLSDSHSSTLNSFMESLALATADLSLHSKTLKHNQNSIKEAEFTWKEQSDLISSYLCKTEGFLKTLQDASERVGVKNADCGGEASQHQGVKRIIERIYNNYKCELADQAVKITTINPPSEIESVVVSQLTALIKAGFSKDAIISNHPEKIYQDYQEFRSQMTAKEALGCLKEKYEI